MADIERSGGKGRRSKAKAKAPDELASEAVAEFAASGLADEAPASGLDVSDRNVADEPGLEPSLPETAAEQSLPESAEGVIEDDVIEGEIEAASSEIAALDAVAWAVPQLDLIEGGASSFEPGVEPEVELEGAIELAPGSAPAEDAAGDEAGAAGSDDVEFVESDRVQSLLESLLFVSDRPVSLGTMKQMFRGTNVGTKDIMRALDALAMEFASASRGVSLEEIQGGYQLRTKVDNADFLRRLAKTRPFRLSGPALEALSIVAYKQPIVKSEIDVIRGVESGHLLRALMERGLVNFAGKSDLPGKPMQYGTTRKFLEIFGLRNLKELPTLAEIDDLIPEGIGDVEEKPILADISASMSQEIGSTYSEGEDELLKITDQLQAIDTSSEFFEQEKQRQRDLRDRERAQNIREALTVGEAVEDKDKRWLERFEAKLLEAEAAAAARAAGLTVPGEDAPVTADATDEEIIAASEAAGEPGDDLDFDPDELSSEPEDS